MSLLWLIAVLVGAELKNVTAISDQDSGSDGAAGSISEALGSGQRVTGEEGGRRLADRNDIR